HHPWRRVESREENRRRLKQEPRDNRVRHRNLVNIAPLQLGEEIVDLHHFPRVIFCTSASKRGSPWRSSRNGSSGRRNKYLLLPPAKPCSSASMARSFSPNEV